MRNTCRRVAIWILVLLTSGLLAVSSSAADGEKKIRVGYMDYDGFIEPDEGGGYRGYGVSWLDKIAQYTGWEYEYVYGNWPELLKRLEDGDLDLVCTAQYTEERGELYDYADIPIGHESAVIYARKDDGRIFYEDYVSMDKKKIGLLSGSYQNDLFSGYEKTHDISLEKLYYDSDREMFDALNNGTVDLLLTGGLALHEDLKVVSQFGSSPFYTITTKGKRKILDPLNDAMNQIRAFSPYFEQEVYEKFYGMGATASTPPLTRQERGYILSADPILVGFVDGSIPLVFKNSDTNETDGILPALVKEIGRESGLPIQCVLLDSWETPAQALEDGKVDLVIGNRSDAALTGNPDICFSETITEDTLVMLTRPKRIFQKDGHVLVTLPMEFNYLDQELSDYFPDYSVQYCKTAKECIDAVATGKADATIQNNFVANYFLQRKQYQSLTAASIMDYSDMSVFVAQKDTDSRLISILNKTILCVLPKTKAQITMAYTIGMPYQDSTADILWYYRYQIAIIAALALMLGVVTYRLFARRTKTLLIQKEAESYRRISERDILTGVYNRQMFYKKARQLLDENPDILYQFIYLNVENFKLVNDLYGTEAGDRLLCRIGKWAKQYSHKIDGIAGRLDADHFVLCVPEKDHHGELVLQLLKKELEDSSTDMKITVNCGVYEAKDRTKKVQLMCDRAHLASNDSKGSLLKPVTYYSDSHREHLMRVQVVLNEMRGALAEGQFQVYLQPQVYMKNGTLSGAEALVRWVHPERGVIPPGEFIPIFEQNGFIARLDLYVYEEVCKLQKRWKDEGRELFPISVNLSRVNFYIRTLQEQLVRIADRYGVETRFLELELTESAYSEDNVMVYDCLRQLQACGFRILMDDFGSGYSALNMLKDAPVDILKLDLRFLYKSDPYHRSWQILRSIVSMAEALNIPVIAEGVETEEQVEVLSKTACKVVQGYYYSKPVCVEEFEKAYPQEVRKEEI